MAALVETILGPPNVLAENISEEPPKPAEIDTGHKEKDDLDSWSTYNFEWLFDLDRIDHLPIEEQLKLFKHRDLGKVCFYCLSILHILF